MTIQIKHRHTGVILHTVDADTLENANLSNLNLNGANLYCASLNGASLNGASLNGASLNGASLIDASLNGANLIDASLNGANLYCARLNGANLNGANLKGVKYLSQFVITPQGAITGYKKTTSGIVTLEIPRSAARVNAYGSRKCRAEYAVVVEAPENAKSKHDPDFTYTVGQTVRPDSYDPDPSVECSHGIHFFLTREEAENY